MTDQNLLDRIAGDSSRRSFLKKGTLASAGLALGGAGSAAAQDEGDDAQQGTQGFMFPNQIVPDAQFRVDAQIDWTPQGGQQDDGEQATTAEEEGDDQGTETETDDGDGGNEGAGGGDEGEDGGDGGDEGDEGGDGDDGNESALQDQNQEDQTQTYVVQYEFSESYYAFLFVPQETEIEEGQSYQLGSDVTGGEQPPVRGTVAVNFSPTDGGQAGTGEGDEGGDDAGGGTDGDGGNGGDTGGDGGDGGDGANGGDDEGDGGLGG